MSWPTPQEYSEAVQNPHINFEDAELRQGTLALSPLGLPLVASGSFASVYRVNCGNKKFAVRCFLKDVPTQHQRYERISKNIMNDQLSYTVDFHYIARGILIRGKWYPILKMDWVEGTTLDAYVRSNLETPERLAHLANQFKAMMNDLQSAGIAHGDLQHGNIMITPSGELRLVDYDGMFVPGLEGMNSNELGHRNYQHPARDATTFSARIDSFSAWSIFTSLIALAVDPSLAEKLQGCDECLLLRQGDYRYPLSSRAFSLLEQHSDKGLNDLSRVVRTLLAMPVEQVPFLSEHVTADKNLPVVQPEADAPFVQPVARPRRAEPAAKEEDPALFGSWPALPDYIHSVSNPHKNFLDPNMQDLILVRDHGSIRAQGSDHGAVFRFRRPQTDPEVPDRRPDVMVKVFLKADQLIQQRYQFLYTYLNGGAVNYTELQQHFVDFTFIPGGMKVGNNNYCPMVKMKYSRGFTLLETVEKVRTDKAAMRDLIQDFVKTINLLQSSGIVHGDIEPDNILVKRNRMVLVDYDLTTTPTSRPLASKILGNRHYRHPKLVEGQDVADSDNFAAWILYYSLKLIMLYPALWNIAGSKPGRLLFHADDLKRPPTSAVFKMLRSHYDSEVRNIAELVAQLCRTAPDAIPPFKVTLNVVDVLHQLQPSRPRKALTTLDKQRATTLVFLLGAMSLFSLVLLNLPLTSFLALLMLMALAVVTAGNRKP